jgi:hypothetical protein
MREMFSRAASAGVVLLVLSGVLTNAASQELRGSSIRGSSSRGSSILEPASGALLGQFYGAGSIEQTTRKLGRTPVIHLAYYDAFPSSAGNPTTSTSLKLLIGASTLRSLRVRKVPKRSARSFFSTLPLR